jgi:hypothetical protein
MTSLHRFLTISAILALSGYGVAHAQGLNAGDYKLAVGSAAPCALTLAADGSAKTDGACGRAGDISHWRATGTGVVFQDNSGTVFATLVAKGDTYAGSTFADSHRVVLTPAGQATAVLAH